MGNMNGTAVRCSRCHRILKDETARNLGFGRVCWSKATGKPFPGKGGDGGGARASNHSGATHTPRAKETGPMEPCPLLTGDVVCSIGADGESIVNIPRRITLHSPNGFSWGYCGSGPADLALNILSMYIGQAEAERGGLYQRFKERFFATLPEEGGTIKREDILTWLAENGVEPAPCA